MKVKTLDIVAKEWWDKVNGNSYFSCRITINFAMPDEKTYFVPFQYGYGEQYLSESLRELKRLDVVPKNETSLWQLCDDKKIILRKTKYRNCLKRDVKEWGKED